jgi:mRNA interferase RelE/StbE
MPYTVRIKRQARNKLQSLSRIDRNRITEKIVMLGNNPDDPSLDVKLLQGESYHRLRVGQWRIIFERRDQLQIVLIEKIKPRGDAYK